MTSILLPRLVRRSPLATAAVVLLTLLVALVEVPQTARAVAEAPAVSA